MLPGREGRCRSPGIRANLAVARWLARELRFLDTPARRANILGRIGSGSSGSRGPASREDRRRIRPRPSRAPRHNPGVPNVPAVDVRLVDVVKKFGDAIAVDHIDLEVQDGEFFTLLGPSGCGKTTTLRMIGGFEEPTAGLIELQGQDVTWLPPYKRNVNTVFQSYALFPHLTIFENVAFGLRRKKVADTRGEEPRRVDARARGAARLRAPQADPDLRRPGPTRRARPGPHQPAGRAPARRAARRPRPQAAQARCRSSSSASSRTSGSRSST